MVHLKKILKLGGFADIGERLQYFGFARKTMPPDTPHDENKTRWRVNNLGQKVEDAGTPGGEIREKYIHAIENTPDEVARTDIVRAVGVMAEKGDEEAGKYLLGLLKTDRSPQVRKTILTKMGFAFKAQVGPFSKIVLAGIRYSVADDESALRGMTVDLLNAASKQVDEHDLNASIKPQNRRTCFLSRDAAWAHVKGIAQAINSSTLILGLVDMMAHAVLPVRMTCWEVLGGKDATATTGRCRELEQRLYRRKLALARCSADVLRCQQKVEDAFEEAMEQSRDAMAKKMRQEQDRGVELHADSSFVTKFQKDLVNTDPAYVAAVQECKELKAQYQSIFEDIAADDEAYQRVKEELKKEILSKIGYLLQDDSPPIAITNKLLGKGGNNSWYIRRTVVRMIGPLAEAGDATATELLIQTLSDRSPYVRRTVVRALKQARWAERERAIARATATAIEGTGEGTSGDLKKNVTFQGMTLVAEDPDKEAAHSLPASPVWSPLEPNVKELSEEGVSGVAKQTPEEKRLLQKMRLRKRAEMDAKARLHSLNIKEFGTKEVVELIESMRMHFMENTDAYKRAARQQSVNGEFMLTATDEELKKVLGMTLRKERTMLRVTMKDKMAQFARETDPAQIAEADKQKLLEAANDAAAQIKALRKEVLDEEAVKKSHIKQAMKQDSYMFGGNEGLGCVLFKDAEGNVIFKRVLPCDGSISEGDVLLKVERTSVQGKSLVEVMHLLTSYGQMCPCVVRLASQKQRLEDLRKRRQEWEEQANSSKKKKEADMEPPPSDLLRTVNVTCQPPPFKEEYIESIGLDIEVYQGDATRSLQMMTVLHRNGFSEHLTPILLDGVKQLLDLAAKHKDPAWVKAIGITDEEHDRFMDLLKRLALRFKLKDPRPEVKSEERREHAHMVWRYMQGVTAGEKIQYTCKYRSQDASATLEDFRITGRTQRQLQRECVGQKFIVLWHERLNIMVEFVHSSTGTFRLSIPRQRHARRLGQSRQVTEGEGGERTRSWSGDALRRATSGASARSKEQDRTVTGGGRKEVVACFSNGRDRKSVV